MKHPVFGIHLGNSTSSLAICKEGKISIVANDIGERVTPAVVAIWNQEKLVGSVGKSLLVQKWDCTITDNKRLMNRSLSNTEKEEACKRHRVATEYMNDELCYSIQTEGRYEKYTPSEIATLIYKNLYEMAKFAVHAKRGDTISCVILVPTDFSRESIDYTRKAVEDAGFKILQIIKEIVSPVLAYSLLNKVDKSNRLVLIFRLGGVSCEAAVVNIFSGFVKILSTSFKENFGASQLIGPLTEYLAEEFFRKYKLDPSESSKSMVKLRQAAENCMHSLSNLNNANCFVESLYEGVDFNHMVSRARLEMYLKPLLSTYSEPIHDVLKKTNLTTDAIQKVILCGGLMKIPKLQSYISGMFASAEVLNHLAPDEVLALGAAQQAGYLVSSQKHKMSQTNSEGGDYLSTESMLPQTYSVEIMDEHLSVKILDPVNKEVNFEKGSLIPHHEKISLKSLDYGHDTPKILKFEVSIKTEKKAFAEISLTTEEKLVHEVLICVTSQKGLEIKIISKNLQLNKRQTRSVHLKEIIHDISASL